jgi:cation transport ATPase
MHTQSSLEKEKDLNALRWILLIVIGLFFILLFLNLIKEFTASRNTSIWLVEFIWFLALVLLAIFILIRKKTHGLRFWFLGILFGTATYRLAVILAYISIISLFSPGTDMMPSLPWIHTLFVYLLYLGFWALIGRFIDVRTCRNTRK